MTAAWYDDGRIACDADGITIRLYYAPFGSSKRVPWAAVRNVIVRPVSARSRCRIWGTGDFRHWAALDRGRPRRTTLIVLDVGKHIRPVFCPDRPDEFLQAVREARPDLAPTMRPD